MKSQDFFEFLMKEVSEEEINKWYKILAGVIEKEDDKDVKKILSAMTVAKYKKEKEANREFLHSQGYGYGDEFDDDFYS